MRRIFCVAISLAILSLTISPGCGPDKPVTSDELNGDGSTFVYPLMVPWASIYEREEGGCKIKYGAGGSTAGINEVVSGRVDFGCTDGPISDEQLATARDKAGEIVHIPLVLGAVVPAYNVPEISDPLRLTGKLLAQIYLGDVKK